jgi:hypothetical protein
MGGLAPLSGERSRSDMVIYGLSIFIETRLAGHVGLTVGEGLHGRTIFARLIAMLINVVAFPPYRFTECLPEQLIVPKNLHVSVNHCHVTRDTVKDDVMFPLEKPGFGNVGGHFNDIEYIARLVGDRLEMDHVV